MKKYIVTAALVLIVVAMIVILLSVESNKNEEELKIGVISTLTGNAAYYGQSTMRGAEIARDYLAETMPKIPVTLVHEDSLFTNEGGISAYQRLRTVSNINALITQASNVSVAVEPLAHKDDILHIGVSTLANAFSTKDDQSFRLTARADKEALVARDFLIKQGSKKLAILYMNNEIGVSLAESLTLNPGSLEIVSKEGFDPKTIDFRTPLLKAKSAGADTVYIAGLASHTITIIGQAKALQYNPVFTSFRAAEDPILFKDGKDIAEGLIYTNVYDANATAVRNTAFVEMYKAKYGEVPNGYAAESFEAVILHALAHKACGVSPELSTQCKIGYLSRLKNYETVLGLITFDEYGDVSPEFFMKKVIDGAFTRVK